MASLVTVPLVAFPLVIVSSAFSASLPITVISTEEPSSTVLSIASIVGESFTLVTLMVIVDMLLSPSELVAWKVNESDGASEPPCV